MNKSTLLLVGLSIVAALLATDAFARGGGADAEAEEAGHGRRWRRRGPGGRRGATSGKPGDEPQSFHEPRRTFPGESSCCASKPGSTARDRGESAGSISRRGASGHSARGRSRTGISGQSAAQLPSSRPGAGTAAGRPDVGRIQQPLVGLHFNLPSPSSGLAKVRSATS